MMFHLDHTPGRTAIVGGREYLFFSGYSYLGMNHVPGFAKLVKEGIDKYGWLFPSSRISNTQLDLFTSFEEMLSAITGMEDTVCFSSGFLAGRAVVGLLQWNHSYFFSAPGTHPAIDLTNGISTIPARDFDNWSKAVVDHTNTIRTIKPIVISLDSVNPLTGEINTLSFSEHIKKPLLCVIDDSHGAGLINNGTGAGGSLPQRKNFIIIYSLSKAYNLVGGAVSCSGEMADQLRTSRHYTAGTSISPAFAYAFLHGQHLYEQQREKLKHNIGLFRSMTGNRFGSHHDLPIFILPPGTDEKALEKAGIIISSFAYPDPGGPAIKRIVLNALHTEQDLELLAKTLR